MIWKRYIVKEFMKLFLFFLFSFYFLYVVIDYSTHVQEFVHGKNLPFWKILQYYSLQFIKRADILFPLGLLLGTIKVLCQLNTNKELLAFQSAGIRMKKLLTPLLFIGGICAVLNIGINEFVVPKSLNFIDKFYDSHLRHSYRGNRAEPLHVLHLDDHSKLVYQYYDHAREAFFDVIWIKSPDDLWRMRYLKIDPDHPQGQWVDHLTRNEEGAFEKTRSFANLIFRDLEWSQDMPRRGYVPYENRSISALWKLKGDPLLSNYDHQEIFTQLLFKLTMPFLSLLVIIAITPFCTMYSKNLPQLLIYACGIFGFVAFIALMDASVILGESDTVSPYVAVLSPFIILLTFFSWRLARVR